MPTRGACSIGSCIKNPLRSRELANQAAPAHRSVADMTATEKLIEAFNRAQINAAFRERLLAALSPEALAAAILTFAEVFVASQFSRSGDLPTWRSD